MRKRKVAMPHDGGATFIKSKTKQKKCCVGECPRTLSRVEKPSLLELEMHPAVSLPLRPVLAPAAHPAVNWPQPAKRSYPYGWQAAAKRRGTRTKKKKKNEGALLSSVQNREDYAFYFKLESAAHPPVLQQVSRSLVLPLPPAGALLYRTASQSSSQPASSCHLQRLLHL